MKILMLVKYPPIQGGVSVDSYWTAQTLIELGHDVVVVTNAEEVEEEYRVNLNSEDKEKLGGFRVPGRIIVRSTTKDPRHVYIPQNNPSVSKLVSLGLEAISEFKPDLIWSFYVEPYGVAALYLSKLSDIPYVVRHAGSDLGRLMPTSQLQTLYKEVFKNASAVLTRKAHFERFASMGVKTERILIAQSQRLPGDIFFPDSKRRGEEFVVGIYGKPGPAKGSTELVRAVQLLKEEGFLVRVKALWNGRHLPAVKATIDEAGVSEHFQVEGFVPHWRMPDFIRSCDVMLFLENNFSITFHGPGIPVEVNSCGRFLITTSEIAKKEQIAPILRHEENCLIVAASPRVEPAELAGAIKRASNIVGTEDVSLTDGLCIDASLSSARSRKKFEEMLSDIFASL